MKKNAGMSTLVITGMAAFIAVFTMVLLVVIKSAGGTSKTESAAYLAAKQKAESINSQFEADVKAADIDILWSQADGAAIFVSNDKFVIMWLASNKTVFRLEAPYTDDAKTAEDKANEAETRAHQIINADDSSEDAVKQLKNSAKAVAPLVMKCVADVSGTVEAGANLQIKIEFTDGKGKKDWFEQTYTTPYSESVVTTRNSK